MRRIIIRFCLLLACAGVAGWWIAGGAGSGSTSLAEREVRGEGLANLPVPAGRPDANAAAVDGPIQFSRDIMPLLSRLKCNQTACHGSPAGRGGFRLSMFGAAPAEDCLAITRFGRAQRVDVVTPADSLLLRKAANTIPHEGGARLKEGGRDWQILLAWIAQGAKFDANQARLVSLTIEPKELLLTKGGTARLKVAASFPDGQRDVTADATFTPNSPIVKVDGAGNVTATGAGGTFVLVSYLHRPVVVRVDVPATLPEGFRFPVVKCNNRIDELVLARLQRLQIPPSPLCGDSEFVRRVYLDTTGLLPSADEARAFLDDPDPDKRAKLIDKLLSSDNFADYWSLRWGDLLRIKSEYPVLLWPKAVAVYYNWLHESIAANKPYDVFVRELLTSTGSDFRCGPANFMRGVPKKDPQTIGETAAVVFMGARLGCARCHAHPQEDWNLDTNLAMAAFFGKVGYKGTTEWKEEIVFVNPKAALRDPRTRQIVKPQWLGGEPLDIAPDEDPRVRFANWLITPDNPWFSASIVNRIWFWLNGRGIIHEPDDIRPTNPPSNPELLAYLCQELASSHYDLKHIYRLILNSRTYQLASAATDENKFDTDNFSHYTLRRLGAEQLLDAICQVTGTAESYSSPIPEPYTRMPAGFRAIQLPDGCIESATLELLGRPSRDTPFERERTMDLTSQQVLFMINSDHLESKIVNSPRLKGMLASTRPDSDLVDELYLSTVCRRPAAAERQKVAEYLAKNKDPKVRTLAYQDLLWALLNGKEFLFDH